MGTRGFIGVIVDGNEHIWYHSNSSYPDYAGVETLATVRKLVETLSVSQLRDKAASLSYPGDVDADDSRTFNLPVRTGVTVREAMATSPGFAAQVRGYVEAGRFGPHSDSTLDASDAETWRWWIDGDDSLDARLADGFYIPNPNFPLDSDYCEWGYLLDLDRDNGRDRPPGVLEVYKGFFSPERPEAGRWAGRPTIAEDAEAQAEHEAWCAQMGREPWLDMATCGKAVAPVAVWALDSLPEDDEPMLELQRRWRAGTLRPLESGYGPDES